MEELNGWLFRASNWLPDFVPQLEEVRGAWLNVEQSARRLFRTSEVACFQATALDDQWPRCSRLRKPLLYTKKKDYFGELRRSLI